MTQRKLLAWSVALLLGAALSQAAEDTKSKKRSTIDSPDVLKICIETDDPRFDLSGEYLVGCEGSISLGCHGAIDVAGLTTEEAGEAIWNRVHKQTPECYVKVERAYGKPALHEAWVRIEPSMASSGLELCQAPGQLTPQTPPSDCPAQVVACQAVACQAATPCCSVASTFLGCCSDTVQGACCTGAKAAKLVAGFPIAISLAPHQFVLSLRNGCQTGTASPVTEECHPCPAQQAVPCLAQAAPPLPTPTLFAPPVPLPVPATGYYMPAAPSGGNFVAVQRPLPPPMLQVGYSVSAPSPVGSHMHTCKIQSVTNGGITKLRVHTPEMAMVCDQLSLRYSGTKSLKICTGNNQVAVQGDDFEACADQISKGLDDQIVLSGHVRMLCHTTKTKMETSGNVRLSLTDGRIEVSSFATANAETHPVGR